ncbi:MAG: histidine phosphatase family protein [Candidatus Yanofskybacteria bacterium]|nr:histidine phosphatase family protein [Candidatus Yanofskybacteria bacterium]
MTADQRADYPIPNHQYPLTLVGHMEAKHAANYLRLTLKDAVPDLFFQSTFLRSQATMEILMREGLGHRLQAPITDSRLDEKWDGIFHELSKKELEQRYPDQIRLRKRSGYYHYRAPGGENCPDVELRIQSFFSDPLIVNANHVLIVGHGRWFFILQKLIHNMTVQEFIELKEKEDCPNCSITEYFNPPSHRGLPESVNPWKDKIDEQPTDFA